MTWDADKFYEMNEDAPVRFVIGIGTGLAKPVEIDGIHLSGALARIREERLSVQSFLGVVHTTARDEPIDTEKLGDLLRVHDRRTAERRET
jgi:thiamine monophosphate synthase